VGFPRFPKKDGYCGKGYKEHEDGYKLTVGIKFMLLVLRILHVLDFQRI
jgi:hypothetical protein